MTLPRLKSYRHTRYACYLCFIVQAITINFAPMLFLIFSGKYDIPLPQITLLVIINFACQFIIDSISAAIAAHLSYRAMAITANFFSALGLISLGILPEVLNNSYVGIVISVLFCAMGGGLIEVIANPIMQSCPKEKKFVSMGLLHSFYCWGHLGVVLISTLFLHLSGNATWQLLSCLWALIPLFNTVYFIFVPIDQPSAELEKTSSLKNLLSSGLFWLFVAIMVFGGACEQAMAQWASAFAELSLVSFNFSPELAKLVGDLLGPCSFALMMGLSRLIFPKLSEKFDLRIMMIISASLCALCYLVASLSSNPFISLIGCGICGFSVGIMWPGTLDLAAMHHPFVGTALFAMLSLAGDLGCMFGPSVVGFSSSIFGNGELKIGLCAATIIPISLVIALILFRPKKLEKSKK